MYLQILIQTLVSFVFLFIIAKCIGCRQISEMSLFDYINGITIGSIAAELAISEDGMLKPLLAMVIYGLAALFLSWLADKSLLLRRIIEGTPYVLFQNDAFVYNNMKKNKIDVCEFLMECREAGYFDLSEVQSVILESNGKFSILPKTAHRPVTPADLALMPEKENLFANIILEGKVMYENLKHIGRDENWLKKQMQIYNVKDEREVFLGICDGNENCYFFTKNNTEKSMDKLI